MRLRSRIQYIDSELIIEEAYRSDPVQDEYLYEEAKPSVEVFRIIHGDARLIQLGSEGLREVTMDHLVF